MNKEITIDNNSIIDPEPRSESKIHYAWIITLVGILVVFSCLGLARFSLGMLLPSMGSALNWNYSQMGYIGTGNFVGYMSSILIVSTLTKRIGSRWTIMLGLFVIAITLILISYAASFAQILLLYTLTGIAAALANIPMMSLISQWFSGQKRGIASGGLMAGAGIAIVVTGIVIPWINTAFGTEGWRTGWATMGMASLVIAVLAGYLLRNTPREKGLLPLGSNDIHSNHRSTLSKNITPTYNLTRVKVHLGTIIFLYGATYSVYTTFIVTELVNGRGFNESMAGNFWSIVGGLSIFSGMLFGFLSDKLGRKAVFTIVNLLFALCYALVTFNLSDPLLYLSIFIFGISVWSIPSIMVATIGDYFSAKETVKAMSFIMLFFGVGQIIGPAVAGHIADITGSFNIAFGICSILSILAAGIALYLKKA